MSVKPILFNTEMVISQNLGEMKGYVHIFHHTNRETVCMFVRHLRGVRAGIADWMLFQMHARIK